MNPLAECPNPFRGSVVADAWQTPVVDVPALHAEAFARCLQAVEFVISTRSSTSLLVHGEAGSGKTHLLSRLRRHFEKQSRSATGAVPPVLISVPLGASPQTMWRHLRQRLVEDVLRGSDKGHAALHQAVIFRLGEMFNQVGERQYWWDYLQGKQPPTDWNELLPPLFDRLDQRESLGRDLCVVLEHLLFNRHPRDVRAWLLGDAMPPAAYERLGVGSDLEAADAPEAAAQRLVLALCRLMGNEIPLLFCFDQIEALLSHPQDRQGLFAYGQLISSLFNQTRNVLLLSCIQSSFISLMSEAVRGSQADRLAEFGKIALKPLTTTTAPQLLSARVQSCPPLLALRPAEAEAVWPLTADDVKQSVAPLGCVARVVLARCADRFENLRGSPAFPPPPSREQVVQQLWADRLAQSSAPPPGSDTVWLEGLPILLEMSEGYRPQTELPADVDLVFNGPAGKLGVCLCNHDSMISLAGKLNRLRQHVGDYGFSHTVLVRDSRMSISKNAKKCHVHLDALKRAGLPLFRPPVSSLPDLQALVQFMVAARTGNLADGEVTLTSEEITAWLKQHLTSSLQELCSKFLPSRSATSSPENQRGTPSPVPANYESA